MNKSVYFYNGCQTTKMMAFGQLLSIGISCYFRGKELGYDKVYVEWYNNNAYLWFNGGRYYGGIKCPRNTVLPMIFMEKGTLLDNVDLIDISKPNSLYEGCLPLISDNLIGSVSSDNYLNKYYQDYGPPFIKLEMKAKEPYILFHYRHSPQERQQFRNISDDIYIELLRKLKSKMNDKYKFYKIGEKFKYDSEFDKVFPYFPRNIDKVFRLIRDASMYVGIPSGPHILAMILHKPMFMIIPKDNYNDVTYENGWKHTEDLYRRRHSKDFKVIGKTGYDYIDTSIQKYISEDIYMKTKDEYIDFIEKHSI